MSLIRLQTCRRCKFGEPVGADGMVECRRYPPIVTAISIAQGAALQCSFPKLNPDLYCGEWKAKFNVAREDIIDVAPEPPIAAMAHAA